MFDGFSRARGADRAGDRLRPGRRQRPAAAPAARLPADAPHVAHRGAPAGRPVHGRRRGPARLRGLVPARPDSGPRRALETGARARPRGGDGRARPRPLRRRGARPGRAGGLPDGARPSRPRDRGGRVRRRAHRRGVVPRRRRDGARLLALGVPRPARAAARAADRGRPRRVLRLPRPGPGPRESTGPLPRGPDDGLPRGCSTTRARCRRSARTTAPGPASIATTTTPTAVGAGSRLRSSLCGAPAGPCRASTATSSTSGGRGPARSPAGGSTPATSWSRTSPSRSPTSCPPFSTIRQASGGPSRPPFDPLGDDRHDRDDSDDRSGARCLRRLGELGRTWSAACLPTAPA